MVTVAANPVRRSADGTGLLEATSVSSAAWLAGVGLLSFTWPGQMDHTLRDDWLDQQTETAWVLADDLAGADWSTLSLPVDGVPTPFHYRESEFGWVLAGSTREGVHVGAYGRGMSAYGLGFAMIKDISDVRLARRDDVGAQSPGTAPHSRVESWAGPGTALELP